MLLGDLSLDAAPATGALDKLESKMGGTTAALGGLSGVLGELATGPIGALTAAIGTAAGIIEGFKSAMDLGQELNDLSLRTGESAGQSSPSCAKRSPRPVSVPTVPSVTSCVCRNRCLA
ncbi:MAG: hypothetical protein WDN28_12835 [Chthoniobacter sp.]